MSLSSESDRRSVAELVGGGTLADWAAQRSPQEVAEQLQSAGVAAGPMNRPDEVYHHPQLRWRNMLADMTHPLFDVPLPAETGPAPFRNIPPAPQRPAPLPGADTRRICHDVLGMSAEQTNQLIDDGVLFDAGEQDTGDRKGVST